MAFSWTKFRRYLPHDLTSAVTILGLVGGAIAFLYQWSQDIDARDRESRKPFLQRQLDTYARALTTTAKIARLWEHRADPANKQPYADAIEEFWSLYLGELAMVEDQHVETAMVIFARSLEADANASDSPCAKAKSDIVLTLSHCARNSVASNWGHKQTGVTDNCAPDDLRNLERLCPVSDERSRR